VCRYFRTQLGLKIRQSRGLSAACLHLLQRVAGFITWPHFEHESKKPVILDI
jgi:hypothetical protein